MRLFLFISLLLLPAMMPAYAEASNLRCYQLCMAQPGAQTDACQQSCYPPQNMEPSPGMMVIDQSCFARCLSMAKMDATCKQECAQRDRNGNVMYHTPTTEMPVYQPQQPSYPTTTNAQPPISIIPNASEPANNSYNDIDFACFKQCRQSGEPRESCQLLCAP